MRRREFIAGLVVPLVAQAQQLALPVIGFIDGGSADAFMNPNQRGEHGQISNRR